MTVKNNTELIETMTLLILVCIQCRQHSVLSIDLIIDQVKDPFLKKGLQMIPDGVGLEYIKETLNTEVDPTDVYRNLVVEGTTMIAGGESLVVMEKRFKTYLSTEDQVKLEVMVKEFLKDWKDSVQTIKVYKGKDRLLNVLSEDYLLSREIVLKSSVSVSAGRALRQVGSESVPALTQLLVDENSIVRGNAAEALGRIGPEAKEAVPVLTQLLEDTIGDVRSIAAKALAKIRLEVGEIVSTQLLVDENVDLSDETDGTQIDLDNFSDDIDTIKISDFEINIEDLDLDNLDLGLDQVNDNEKD